MVISHIDHSKLAIIMEQAKRIAIKVDELNQLIKDATDLDLIVILTQSPERTGNPELVENSLLGVDFNLYLRKEIL